MDRVRRLLASPSVPWCVCCCLPASVGARSRACVGRIWILLRACGRLPNTFTKNGVAHVVPLVPAVVVILQQIFHGWTTNSSFRRVPKKDEPSPVSQNRKRDLAKLASVDAFTLHDFRRTAATGLAALGVAPHVIERLLNHVTGTLGGVAGVYNRFRYRDEVRQGLTIWTNHLLAFETAQVGVMRKFTDRSETAGDAARFCGACATRSLDWRGNAAETFAVNRIVD